MTTQIMVDVNSSLHITTVQYGSGDFKVVDHRDEKFVRVYDSLKSGEVAQFNYGERFEMGQKEARIRGTEYANGAADYYGQGCDG